MPVLLKLIGCQNNYEIHDDFCGDFNINNVIFILNKFDISDNDINNIKFLHNNYESNNISVIDDYNKIICINNDETYNVYIYSNNNDIKKKLELVFYKINNEYENNNIDNNNNENETKNIIDINLHNKKIMNLLNNDDLKTILKIYKNNPDIFISFIQLITNIDDIELNDDIQNIDYDNLINIINNLNLGFSNEDIIIKLKKYKGHLNLTLRSLISNI